MLIILSYIFPLRPDTFLKDLKLKECVTVIKNWITNNFLTLNWDNKKIYIHYLLGQNLIHRSF